MKHLVLAGRLILGAWLLVNGLNHFFVPLYAEPMGTQPLAVQLMSSLVHSKLFDVAMAVQLIGGAFILSGFFLPVALCVVMPISTCAAFWAVILEHEPVGALAAIALVGAQRPADAGLHRLLQGHAAAARPDHRRSLEGDVMNFEDVFVNTGGRTSRAPTSSAPSSSC